jgi:hypothetical protein
MKDGIIAVCDAPRDGAGGWREGRREGGGERQSGEERVLFADTRPKGTIRGAVVGHYMMKTS